MEHKNWNGFKSGAWQNEINVRDFIQQNYKAYEGDDSFLAGATARTNEMMKKVNSLFKLERQYGGVLDIDTTTVSSLTAYAPGYIDKEWNSHTYQTRTWYRYWFGLWAITIK